MAAAGLPDPCQRHQDQLAVAGDQGTDAMEREKQFLMASKEGRYLWHLNEALRRLYNSPENFGKCHQCGAMIDFERLDALPHARLCISCKEKEEDAKKR